MQWMQSNNMVNGNKSCSAIWICLGGIESNTLFVNRLLTHWSYEFIITRAIHSFVQQLPYILVCTFYCMTKLTYMRSNVWTVIFTKFQIISRISFIRWNRNKIVWKNGCVTSISPSFVCVMWNLFLNCCRCLSIFTFLRRCSLSMLQT